MLSGYLGKLGVRNIVLEKEAGITTDPRGIALDDDGIRLIQGLGLYEHIFREIGTCKEIDREAKESTDIIYRLAKGSIC
jgi:2-polyprenyl-6-methoxyphenol hydroxylase-like FAD-dependent oxidoreductase